MIFRLKIFISFTYLKLFEHNNKKVESIFITSIYPNLAKNILILLYLI